MRCPPAVARGLVRLGAGLLLIAALVAVGGALAARQRLGSTAGDTRARAAAEVQARVSAITRALDAAAIEASRDGTAVEQATTGATTAVSALFARVLALDAANAPLLVGLTVYGPDATPLAWAGRPSIVPASRLAAGPSVFLVPTSLGHRLARVEPIHLPNGGRRVGAVVAEAALSESGAALSPTQAPAVIQTSLARAVLDPTPADLPEPGSFVVTTAGGAVLGRATIATAEVEDARVRWWAGVVAIEWAIGALGLLLMTGPLADWRAASPTAAAHTVLSVAIVVVALGALGGVERALDGVVAASAPGLRLLARGACALGLAWIAATALHRWRHGLRARCSPRASWSALAVLAVAAVPVGLAVGRYGALVAGALPSGWTDIARVSLSPVDAGHLSAAAGLIAAQSAAYVLFVTWLGAVPLALGGRDGRRGWRRALAVALGLLAGTWWSTGGAARLWPALVAALGVLAMWLAVGATRRLLARGSQPARLLVLGLALVLPSVALYPALAAASASSRARAIEQGIAGQVANQRRDLQQFLREALRELDAAPDLLDLVTASTPPATGPVGVDAAFHAWSQTVLSTRRLTSSVELYDARGRLASRFALNLPETSVDQAWRETTCAWELFEEVSPFFAEERRLLHAGRGLCGPGRDGRQTILGSVVVHVVLDYGNLPFLAAQNPYVDLLRPSTPESGASTWNDALSFVVYGWSRRPLFVSGRDAWPLSDPLFGRIASSRDRFWTTIEDRGEQSDVYLLNDRGAIYAVGYPRTPLLGHLAAVAEIVVLAGLMFAALLIAVVSGAALGGRAPVSGRALLRDVRTSFSRTLFLAFVAAVVTAVVALALVTRAYMTTILRADVEQEATQTALSASRVVEDFGTVEARGASGLPVLDDSLLVWLSRIVGEDINVFAGTGLLASSERNLFASGLLPTRTPGAIYRALALEGRPTAVTRERVGDYEYIVASAPVRLDDRQAIVSVPITTRQRQIERQLDELDRRVLLAAIAFILLGSIIGYWAAERISDPVSRLTRATRRLAAGDLDARLLVRSSDELGRLVEAFNGMADDLQRQRGQLERTNRLEAWAEMARQVAHDIKNPLTPIQLNAEHLRRVHEDRGRPLGALVDDCIANILLQVRLLRQLAAEFSSFASAPQARPEPTPLAPLLDEILAPYRLALAGRIDIRHAVAAGVPPAFVDRVLLARALTNVVENALHAMPGQGTLDVSAARDPDGTIALLVADTGVGMDETALARIFEPYFSTKATGTGLGLTIARRNVELNGGRIAVTSTPGVGTQVTLYVPASDQAAGPSDGAAESPATSATGSTRRERNASHSTSGDIR